MDRVIKFRAWDLEDKRMIVDEQDFIPLLVTNKGVLRLSHAHEVDLWQVMPLERFNFMQFTGLTDRNGVEIYEGDIVLYNRNIGKTIDKYKYVVKYSIDKYILDHDFSEIENDISWDMVEVIGNIYENSDLLATV